MVSFTLIEIYTGLLLSKNYLRIYIFQISSVRDNFVFSKCWFLIHNHFYNILRFLLFHQIFLSPQVKQCAVITYKHGIQKFSYELPTYDHRKLGNNRKVSKPHRMIPAPNPPAKINTPPILAKNPRKTEITPPTPNCTTPHENQSQPQMPRESPKAPSPTPDQASQPPSKPPETNPAARLTGTQLPVK